MIAPLAAPQDKRGKAILDQATGLVGTSFQLHGRDQISGVDCLGLLLLSLEQAGFRLPPVPAYRLRNIDIARFEQFARQIGLLPVAKPDKPGDIVMMRTGPAQLHLGLRCSCLGLVHADSRLDRVNHQPPPLPWPHVGGWRA